jgi:hypothetical protein
MFGKTMRHGLSSKHPKGGPDNRTALSTEIGHLKCAIDLLEQRRIVDADVVEDCRRNKARTLAQWLHFNRVSIFIRGREEFAVTDPVPKPINLP